MSKSLSKTMELHIGDTPIDGTKESIAFKALVSKVTENYFESNLYEVEVKENYDKYRVNHILYKNTSTYAQAVEEYKKDQIKYKKKFYYGNLHGNSRKNSNYWL